MANVYPFRVGRRGKIQAPVKHSDSYDTPVILDNGSYECRAGFASGDSPSLVFKNVMSKQRRKDGEGDVVLVGPEIENVEALRNQVRTPFDRNVVTQYDAQEQILDYVFSQLGVTGDRVPFPIVMTEPICNPNRRYMSELLFECYRVPSVCYGVDGLFSFYNVEPPLSQQQIASTGLVVSFGYEATHVVPVVNGAMDVANVRRINLGGYHLDFMMQRLLQLKYPIHSSSVTLSRCEEIVQEHCFVAADDDSGGSSGGGSAYAVALEHWLDIDYYERHAHRMQLPHAASATAAAVAAAAIAGERQAERARLLGEKARVERIAEKQHVLDQLAAIRALSGGALHRRLAELGVDSLSELQCHVNAVRGALDDLKAKLLFKDDFAAGRLTADSLQHRVDELDAVQSQSSVSALSAADVAEYYQLHVAVERVRVPELLFQPSMLGIGQGGVGETLAFVLGKYDADLQQRLASHVLLTGGCAALPGMARRVEQELRAIRPFGSHSNVSVACGDPQLAAWHGARAWANSGDAQRHAVHRRQYDECGGDYLMECCVSNRAPRSANVEI